MSGAVLVTGASGFLGRRLVQALCEHGDTVISRTSQDGDIRRDRLNADGVRHVFHLAAKTFVPDSWRDPMPFYEVNVLGTVNVLEFCREQHASLTLLSSYVYGHPERLPISEDHPLRAFNPYGHSKILAEEVARFYELSYDIPLTIVRPFNLYGPSQHSRFLVPKLIYQALSREYDAISVADLRPKRDYVYVDDVVDMLIRFLDPPGRRGTYNAGSGVSISVGELIELVSRMSGIRKAVCSENAARPDEVMDTVADISRACNELNWLPKTPLEEGLKRTMSSMIVANPELCAVHHAENM